MVYAGIGSRTTPQDVLIIMQKFAFAMAKRGYTLRSGGANGADTAFELGAYEAGGLKEIYLPWKEFNSNASKLYSVGVEALGIAAQYHPAWDRLNYSTKKLMGRNSYQIFGQDLKSPCDFVVCWTPDGYNNDKQRTKDSGGTGQAIDMAVRNGIIVYNIKNETDLVKLRDRFGKEQKHGG